MMVVAVVGTLNPSAGDVSVFLPTEQAALAHTAEGAARTMAFARYNLVGSLAGAVGALASGLPALAAARWAGSPFCAPSRASSSSTPPAPSSPPSSTWGSRRRWRCIPPSAGRHPLAESRAIVLRLATLFSVDSFGGGFVVQSLLVLWLYRRFQLDQRTTAAVFFFAGTLSAFSQVLSPWVAAASASFGRWSTRTCRPTSS